LDQRLEVLDLSRRKKSTFFTRVDLLPHAQLLRWYVRHRDALDGVAELVDAEAAVVVRVEHLEEFLNVLRLDDLLGDRFLMKIHDFSMEFDDFS
jgi:hypothetical protein